MTLAEQLRQEGRQEGLQEGGSEEAQRSVVDVLEIRFGRVPEGLAEEIRHEKNLVKLRALLREATLCPTIEAFASNLNK